jgi:hypothetical protein
MAWLNFNTIQDDLVTLLSANVSGAKRVKKQCDDRDYHYANFPLIDVRLRSSSNQVRAGRDYFTTVTFEVQVTVHDLSGFDEAATLRDTVLSDAIDTVRNNANFSAQIETSSIGPIEFSNAKDEGSGAFMAAATFDVIVEAFVDK